MASCGVSVLFVILAVLPLYSSGETCLSPTVKSEVYTTSEATMSTETIVIVEFTVNCKNGLKDLNLYAEFEGKILPTTQVESGKYQVSMSEEHKNLPAGKYAMRIFDEEGYADIRKAQRSGENMASIKSLFTVAVNHHGASLGPWVQSEMVAAGTALLVWYFAYNARSKLLA